MLSFHTSPRPKASSYFFSQPHQPFFVFGIGWAILSMIVFVLSHHGTIHLQIAENAFHLYTLAFIVFMQFFHGFLFTTFPRFCTSMSLPREVYTRIVWLYQIGGIVFMIGSLLHLGLALAGMAILLFAQSMAVYTLRWVYVTGQSPIKDDPKWILISHYITLALHLIWWFNTLAELFGYGTLWMNLYTPITLNLFFIFLTFAVAQRMIPFFSHSSVAKPTRFVLLVFSALVAKTLSAIAGWTLIESTLSIVLSGYLFYEFLRWKLHPLSAPAILWILHLALFWLPLGLALSGITQIIEALYGVDFLFAGIHLLVLGFLTTILIGFGTRVTLGHSGQPPHADRIAVALFIWTQVVVISRFAYSVQSVLTAEMEWLFDIAAAGWILLFVAWASRYGETLIFGKKIQ